MGFHLEGHDPRNFPGEAAHDVAPIEVGGGRDGNRVAWGGREPVKAQEGSQAFGATQEFRVSKAGWGGLLHESAQRALAPNAGSIEEGVG
jgi:hypothetical protein